MASSASTEGVAGAGFDLFFHNSTFPMDTPTHLRRTLGRINSASPHPHTSPFTLPITECTNPMSVQSLSGQGWVDSDKVAGPSTPVGLPSPRPTGGIESKTTADATKDRTGKEEGEVTVSNFYRSHIPRASERSFGLRYRNGAGTPAGNGVTALCNAKTPPNSRNGYGRNWVSIFF